MELNELDDKIRERSSEYGSDEENAYVCLEEDHYELQTRDYVYERNHREVINMVDRDMARARGRNGITHSGMPNASWGQNGVAH